MKSVYVFLKSFVFNYSERYSWQIILNVTEYQNAILQIYFHHHVEYMTSNNSHVTFITASKIYIEKIFILRNNCTTKLPFHSINVQLYTFKYLFRVKVLVLNDPLKYSIRFTITPNANEQL